MKLLTIDTSTSVCSLALSAGQQLLAEELLPAGPATTARLAPALARLLRDAGISLAELAGFGVTIGPGAFTGLRVGIALVKGLALATGKPVAPISSLALLAMNLPCSGMPVCPLFDARKGEVYAALYRWQEGLSPVVPEQAAPPALFLAGLEGEILFLGEGAVRYRPLIVEMLGQRAHFAPFPLNQPRAAAGAPLVHSLFATGSVLPPEELMPRYLRLSEAELSKR